LHRISNMPISLQRLLPWMLLALWMSLAATAQTQSPGAAALNLRLVPLRVGLSDNQAKNTPLEQTPIAKEAAKVGLDLAAPPHPLVAAACRDGRMFYLFYKGTEEAFGERAWMLQRIRKTERTWLSADGPPEEKVTYLVEAFKTIGGTLKGSDQHFGSFALRDAQRREVIKEYEIGFGEIEGLATGAAWPFDLKRPFHMLQDYAPEAALYDQVKFTQARNWRLTVSFARDGAWTLVSPELGLNVPASLPDLEQSRPKIDPASRSIVLLPGQGLATLTLGQTTAEDALKALGKALEDVPAGTGGRNLSFAGGLTCNFDGQGKLNTLFTRSSFGGQAGKGLRHGQTRDEVRKLAGAPISGTDQDPTWTYPGLLVKFDATDVVARFVVMRN
jgi:hypothetical protein